VPRREYSEKRISADLERIIENRSLYVYTEGDRKLPVIDDTDGGHYLYCAMPMIVEGDVIGCVASLMPESESSERRDRETDIKLIKTAASFLGKQLES
jgi:AbrB family transcriptional regulator (stage V sporulation protein T)